MSDAYGYSYSYTGSYTGDDYSYSYSDSATEEKAKAHPQPSAAARKAKDDDTGSYEYSYSYSYTDPSSPPRTNAPGKGAASNTNKVTAAAVGNGKNGGAGDDYSYSYSYSDHYDDYSYSDTDSQAQPMRRQGPTPTPAEAAVREKGSLPIPSPQPRPPRQLTSKAPAAANGGTGSYSYSYSYTDDVGQRSKRPAGPAGADDGSSYYYSDDYGSSPYSYSDDGSYYTDSYSYTGDSSYYYSSSATNASRGGGRVAAAHKAKKDADKDEDSSSYYYSDSYDYSYTGSYKYSSSDSYYSGSTYYYTEDSYYYSDSYEDSDYYYYSSSSAPGSSSSYYGEDEENYDYSNYSYSYTDSARSKSASSTTSSYGYTSSHPSVMSLTGEETEQRETLVLRAPAKDTPHVPAAPRRCFVTPKSVEDAVWAFLQRLMRLQQAYEARRAAAATSVVPASSTEKVDKKNKKDKKKGNDKKKAEKKMEEEANAATAGNVPDADEETVDPVGTPFIPTKDGCFSERSLRIAFQVLRFNHLERIEALKNAPVPVPMETMYDIYGTCVAARAKERVAQAFLAHDTYRSGEVSLSVMGGLLRRLGLGTSPIMQGFRISLAVSSDTVPEMVMNVEQLVQAPAPVSAAADNQDSQDSQQQENADPSAAMPPAKMSMQWEVTPVYVSRIVRKNAAAKKSTPVQWTHNTIYMGRHVIVRNVTSETLFERLKTHIEAVTYLCVVANIFTIHDADRSTVTVTYPQLVRSVLLAEPPVGHRAGPAPAAAMKLLAIENLYRSVFHPMEVLHSFEAGRGFPRYLHDWAVESTLHSTNDTEEKRRRNVVPGITSDSVRFVPAPPTRPPTEMQLSFLLQKVRVPGRPPASARCFCLVSAITPANVFLPAIEVPVRDVVKSSKDPGGYTWVFHSKKHPKKDAILRFAGPAVDRIYVECCYETRDPPLTAAEEDGADAHATGSTTLADTDVATVWCAGYAVFGVEGAKTTALPVSVGSLLQGVHGEPPSATPPEGAAGTPRKSSGVFARFVSSLCTGRRKIAAATASNIKVEIVKSKEPVAGVEKLPGRFIAYQRHVPMIAQLRTAVEVVGAEATYALQALRQQAVRYIFAVAADAALLDQLCALWAHRTKHWTKAERKDEKEQHAQLLNCVAALYALHNCCAGSTHLFAQALVKEKALQMSVDASAPLLPVRV
ncbi:hypothetical protein ABB37_00011 [Leptomonas pyrrhocoris]|uniref:EF-hand domain-containing protein n=1 Tax=Leptomonas pyrrhocoris TaxID=157538 RepID=A0A0N0DZT4_LEPPY|nr:hypothetical protein ABB37_00011 [Leptomonas pyrrhocoris]XP_015664041.1 hypothetical protein ABB37_00011 [Leptomonas pyrrhocoris]KPA85601.1 hypothetical protein ABB37_00011 [Leptomonas pyrrhocoris]KPA85602.1 hypothetical protein ABB37_00011 [Leptomonas pyrrhocoris]|eukprot:XP_015664040.1 hypothetical protein ABB37_00011 [Leptomonas pyrrhocoris]